MSKRSLHTAEVAGSNPAEPIVLLPVGHTGAVHCAFLYIRINSRLLLGSFKLGLGDQNGSLLNAALEIAVAFNNSLCALVFPFISATLSFRHLGK